MMDEESKIDPQEIAEEVAANRGLRGFVPFKFQGMSNTLRKRLMSWKMGMYRKQGGKAYFAPWQSEERRATKPAWTNARREKRRRINKLARKARRIQRIFA